jgi:ribosomal protein L40E
VFGLLDPEFDSDGDGVKNVHDAFPDDENEWNDTDQDMIGDNSDDDDDNDGFPDDVEIAALTDPRNPRSMPQDFDGDGILDYLDDDDDDDGMPDVYEREKGFDPYDAADANYDPDGDGRTNLEEYIDGTDPFFKRSNGSDRLEGLVLWLFVGFLLLVLLISIGLFVFALARRHRQDFELDEEDAEGADWEVREELDPSEAMVCLECSSVFPIGARTCPFCGSDSIGPYSEE